MEDDAIQLGGKRTSIQMKMKPIFQPVDDGGLLVWEENRPSDDRPTDNSCFECFDDFTSLPFSNVKSVRCFYLAFRWCLRVEIGLPFGAFFFFALRDQMRMKSMNQEVQKKNDDGN